MSLPGSMELFVILGVVLLLFGPSKLPQLGQSLGSFFRNFKQGLSEQERQDQDKQLPKDT